LLLKADGLLEPAVGEPVRRRLRAAGIGDERVELLSRTPDTLSHLALYNRVDVALDTYPYNGTTTTCEALLMGVPVVTIAGKAHSSRVGISLLSALGRPEWIASSPDGYVRRAAELAADLPRLAERRVQLRNELRASPLMDHAGQAERFSAALRACWVSWCGTNAASSPPRVQEPINS
jgi:predicted O-linked N-acetylglucosamine transferase (SPINDLY family)